MDAAILTEALDSLELFQSVVEHFPAELIEAELSLLPKSQQLRFIELRERLTIQDLAQRVRQSTTWEEIEQIIASGPSLKQEIWALLSNEEKERIKILKIEAAIPIDPQCESLVGKRVYVTPGTYRQSGEGVVECDRGYGNLRGLEVRLPNGHIQFCSLKDARLPLP